MNKKLLFSIAGIAVVTVVMFFFAEFSKPRRLQAAQLLPENKPLTPFILVDDGGRMFTEEDLMGEWSFIFFGYTFCPDVCPLELQKIGQVLKQFDELNSKEKPQVIFVSVDPERDTQEILQQYTEYFHPNIIGVTGENFALGEFARQFAASFSRVITEGEKLILVKAGSDMPDNFPEHYTVNHTSRFFIVNPQGQYLGSFPPPHRVEPLLADIKVLLSQ